MCECVCPSVGCRLFSDFFYLFKTIRIIVRCFQCVTRQCAQYTYTVTAHVWLFIFHLLHYWWRGFRSGSIITCTYFSSSVIFLATYFFFFFSSVSHFYCFTSCSRICFGVYVPLVCECMASNSHLPTAIHLVALCTLFIFTDIQTDKK